MSQGRERKVRPGAAVSAERCFEGKGWGGCDVSGWVRTLSLDLSGCRWRDLTTF